MWHEEQWKNEPYFHILINFGRSGYSLTTFKAHYYFKLIVTIMLWFYILSYMSVVLYDKLQLEPFQTDWHIKLFHYPRI